MVIELFRFSVCFLSLSFNLFSRNLLIFPKLSNLGIKMFIVFSFYALCTYDHAPFNFRFSGEECAPHHHSACWHNSVSYGCRTEVSISWLSARGHSKLHAMGLSQALSSRHTNNRIPYVRSLSLFKSSPLR